MSQKKGKKPAWVEHDLTEREITVLRLVADGKTNKEIANNLDLSEKTVKNGHPQRADRIGTETLTEAAPPMQSPGTDLDIDAGIRGSR